MASHFSYFWNPKASYRAETAIASYFWKPKVSYCPDG
jgi:hypothetical protein